ncbi:MAG: deoxyribodipyrimidine photo-lyase [Paracoccus sp. (in: a-proteobacteria)]|uniref:cryptochrome/photolyase family protein n=1 Tax=Paracoccus sp. TaxID=267 RepID=UPI0026DF9E8F|nr:deoxyribodipyrimidine photo-lyase [Paracoccus sp. (in: a-proteobacteria)]MDO5613260.1 deoxyribodipyrimidine photo-lyase [Paracoccus sp. (in: a-proteobacteria)]
MSAPVIWWVGRDLRLTDNPALVAAAASGPVLPLMVLDTPEDALGAAPAWRLGQAMRALADNLAARGSRLIVRRGDAATVLAALMAQTGAQAVHLNSPRPFFSAAAVRVALGEALHIHPGNWLLAPGSVKTGAGGAYQKFTPFWRNLRGRDIAAPMPVPRITAPAAWPASDDWQLGTAMRRGAAIVARETRAGQAAALARLAEFLDGPVQDYTDARNLPAHPGTSGLSDALAVGEISARHIWHAATAARAEGAPGAETFLSELAWRDFARDLYFHSPAMDRQAWRAEWDSFPWRDDNPDAGSWRRGLTGIDIVDAGMREVYATGRMHNRVRMIAASFLTKHLLTHWRIGLDWFADTLTDWDPASNAMNWQWVAGSGPDAAPYFRIFNPDTQAAKFDPRGDYCRYWLSGPGDARFRAAIPLSWDIPSARPAPVIGLAQGRARALAAYEAARQVPG